MIGSGNHENPSGTFCFFIGWNLTAHAQVERIDPPFWWTQMPVTEMQIQLYGKELGNYRATIDVPEVEIVRQVAVDSPNYLFLYLKIAPSVEAGTIPIELVRNEKRLIVNYELKTRESRGGNTKPVCRSFC